MTERDVLRRAKEVLLERGWRNDGSYGSDCGKGPVCVMGALGVVTGGSAFALAGGAESHADGRPLVARLATFCPPELASHNGPPEWTLLNFNDDVASFEDIIDLLDRAIASLEVETLELVA